MYKKRERKGKKYRTNTRFPDTTIHPRNRNFYILCK